MSSSLLLQGGKLPPQASQGVVLSYLARKLRQGTKKLKLVQMSRQTCVSEGQPPRRRKVLGPVTTLQANLVKYQATNIKQQVLQQ